MGGCVCPGSLSLKEARLVRGVGVALPSRASPIVNPLTLAALPLTLAALLALLLLAHRPDYTPTSIDRPHHQQASKMATDYATVEVRRDHGIDSFGHPSSHSTPGQERPEAAAPGVRAVAALAAAAAAAAGRRRR